MSSKKKHLHKFKPYSEWPPIVDINEKCAGYGEECHITMGDVKALAHKQLT